MTTTAIPGAPGASGTPGSHPILGCAQTIAAALADVAEVDPLYMSPDDKAAALLAVQTDLDRLAELQLRILATAADVAEATGARDPAAWLATHAHLDRPDARRRHRLARALATTWHRLAEALREGLVTSEQAHVIARALDQLPDDLDPSLCERAEKHLIDLAGDHTPRQLRRLGRKILDVVAPEIGEDHERKQLEDEERHAARKTWLSLRDAGDGTTWVKGRLPTPIADRLRTYLDAYTSPRRPEQPTGSASSQQQRAPYDVRLGRAFGHLLEHLDPTRLPLHGGAATTVVVTLDLDALRSGLGVATTDTGATLTAGEARRLACTASLLPAVLGGQSEVLDLGRTRRLFSPAQRKALALRDRHCRAQGCETPAARCEAHHRDPWSHGGKTDLDHGLLLCSWHHHRAHDPDYQTTHHPDRTITFHRRT